MADTRHGYTAQDEFEARWAKLGKRGWLWRFRDSSDLYGRNNNKLVITDAQPADFLCGLSGWVGFVECKATKDLTGFKIGSLRKTQSVYMTLSHVAQTPYMVAIKQELTSSWFLVPGNFILQQKGTIKWAELALYAWPAEITCPILTI
jgi:hypothetical protein